MRVVIFTTFSDIQKAYSLNIVTQNQIKQLLLHGYKPVVIVHEPFKPEGIYAHPNVTIEKIPNVPCHNEVKKDPTFEEDVAAIEKRLLEILKDGDVVITHDVIYQNAALKHNFAARRVARKVGVKWLHWIHSATSPLLLSMLRPLFTDEYISLVTIPFPNAKYIYPNAYAVPAVAKNFGVTTEDVRVVHHPTDICGFLGISREVEEFVYEKDILTTDAVTTYPVRLDRGKQVQFVIRTSAMLKEFGLSVRCTVIDFHSTGGDKVTYRDELKQIGIDYGLSENELIFTSQARKEWELEVPQTVVRDLQPLLNLLYNIDHLP